MLGIYTASKTSVAHLWRGYRDDGGLPIASTWIDEAGVGETADFGDLWTRCVREASQAEVLVCYREPDHVLKGGWVEVGAALASGVPVFAVGIETFSVRHHPLDTQFGTVEQAMIAAAARCEGPPLRFGLDRTQAEGRGWMVIGVDNFDRESVADCIVARDFRSEAQANVAARALNHAGGHDTFYRAVPHDYKLCRGMWDLV